MPQIILADYSMPSFNALRALKLLRQRQLDIPFIVVTGTISEDTAVQCIKEGADDYLIKDRLARLAPAILHSLEEKRLRDEKRSAEAALRQSEQRYRSLVEHSPDAILVVAHDGRIAYVNNALARLLGASERKQLLGRDFLDFVPADYRAQIVRRTQEMLDHGRPTPLLEQQFVRLDGTPVDVEAGRHSMHLRRFAGHSAHRSRHHRTPSCPGRVAATPGRVDARHPSDHDGRACLRICARNQPAALCNLQFRRSMFEPISRGHGRSSRDCFPGSSRLQPRPIERARFLRRVGRFLRKSPPRQTTADINELICGVLELLQFDLRQGQVVLQSNFTEPLPPVKVDSIQIEQVLVNLIRNAIEAMAGNPRGDRPLVLRTELVSPDRIRVAVQDAGRGVDSGQKSRLFEPFFTTNRTGYPMRLSTST